MFDINNLAAAFSEDNFAFIDLTHPMRHDMPVWPTHPRFCQEVIESYDNGDVACNHSLCLSEHSGTHFDAPLHFIRGGTSIAQVPPVQFFGRMATIGALDAFPCEALGAERILAFERSHGPIQAGDAVFFHFGWDRFWSDTAQHERFLSDWPGLSKVASELLVERGARIVGSDCLSVDRYGSSDFPAHKTLLGADILVGENFANLGRLPPYCFLVALPLAIAGGSGSPARAIALVGTSATQENGRQAGIISRGKA